MTLFRDDWKTYSDGRKKIPINEPKPIFGQVVQQFVIGEKPWIMAIRMSSGVLYYNTVFYDYNPLLYTDSMKQNGWDYLHRCFTKDSAGREVIDKKQEEELTYMVSKHLLIVKNLTKEGKFKDLSIEISEFVDTYSRRLNEFGINLISIKETT